MMSEHRIEERQTVSYSWLVPPHTQSFLRSRVCAGSASFMSVIACDYERVTLQFYLANVSLGRAAEHQDFFKRNNSLQHQQQICQI
jgi:hypothetical protein